MFYLDEILDFCVGVGMSEGFEAMGMERTDLHTFEEPEEERHGSNVPSKTPVEI
jgi:hypothetical protein